MENDRKQMPTIIGGGGGGGGASSDIELMDATTMTTIVSTWFRGLYATEQTEDVL